MVVTAYDMPVVEDLGWGTPRIMGIGPVPSTKKLMERLDHQIADVDLIEINEAFAPQSLACLRQLGLPDDAEHVHPYGEAIVLWTSTWDIGRTACPCRRARVGKAKRKACGS